MFFLNFSFYGYAFVYFPDVRTCKAAKAATEGLAYEDKELQTEYSPTTGNQEEDIICGKV